MQGRALQVEVDTDTRRERLLRKLPFRVALHIKACPSRDTQQGERQALKVGSPEYLGEMMSKYPFDMAIENCIHKQSINAAHRSFPNAGRTKNSALKRLRSSFRFAATRS